MLHILFKIEQSCCEPSGIDFVLITASASGDKPASEKPASNKPAGDKPAGDKPASDKPATDITSSKKAVGELRKGEYRYMQLVLYECSAELYYRYQA